MQILYGVGIFISRQQILFLGNKNVFLTTLLGEMKSLGALKPLGYHSPQRHVALM